MILRYVVDARSGAGRALGALLALAEALEGGEDEAIQRAMTALPAFAGVELPEVSASAMCWAGAP